MSRRFEQAAKQGGERAVREAAGHNLASCERIIEIARAHGVRGWVSAQRKYLPHFIAARKKLAQLPVDFIDVGFTYYWPPAFGAMGWRGGPSEEWRHRADRHQAGMHSMRFHWMVGEPVSVFAQLGAFAPGAGYR